MKFCSFIFIEQRHKPRIVEAVNFTLYPVVNLIDFDGTRIPAEVIQQPRHSSSPHIPRSVRQQKGELVIGSAPQRSVDEKIFRQSTS